MDVNHLRSVRQSTSRGETTKDGDRPAFRLIREAFCDHLPNERGLSAWCDHLCVCACANGGRREFLLGGALFNFLSARVKGRIAHREIECIKSG